MLSLEELGATGNKVRMACPPCMPDTCRLCEATWPAQGLASLSASSRHMALNLHACALQGLVGLTTNPVLANGIAGLATSATAQSTVQVGSRIC